jgi:hypothetical protein
MGAMSGELEKTWVKDSGEMCVLLSERVAFIRWFVSQEISPQKARFRHPFAMHF